MLYWNSHIQMMVGQQTLQNFTKWILLWKRTATGETISLDAWQVWNYTKVTEVMARVAPRFGLGAPSRFSNGSDLCKLKLA